MASKARTNAEIATILGNHDPPVTYARDLFREFQRRNPVPAASRRLKY